MHTHQRTQGEAIQDPRNERQARCKLPRFPLRQENKTKPSFQSWKRNAIFFLMPGACDFYPCFHLKIVGGNKRGTASQHHGQFSYLEVTWKVAFGIRSVFAWAYPPKSLIRVWLQGMLYHRGSMMHTDIADRLVDGTSNIWRWGCKWWAIMQIQAATALLMEIITIRPTIKQRSKTRWAAYFFDSTVLNLNKIETLKTHPSAALFWRPIEQRHHSERQTVRVSGRATEK